MNSRTLLGGTLVVLMFIAVACGGGGEAPAAAEEAPTATSAEEPTAEPTSTAAPQEAETPEETPEGEAAPPTDSAEVEAAYPAPDETESAESEESVDSAYPAPEAAGGQEEEAAVDAAYPAPAPEATPLFDADEAKFSITRPLMAGDTTVSGTGPKGISIQLFNATDQLGPLGTTVIGDDGNFTIELNEPLLVDKLIGIQIIDPPSDVSMYDYANALVPFAGDNSMDVPIPEIGVLWDTATVGSP